MGAELESDGPQPPAQAIAVHSSSDSAADGTGEIRQPRMYQLVRQKGPIQDATFKIEFPDPGVEAFSFTFG